MMKSWILVCDLDNARIGQRRNGAGPIEVVWRRDNPDGRKRAHDVYTDRDGRFRGRDGTQHGAGDSHPDFHHQMARKWAGPLVDELEARRQEGRFDALVLVAPPMLLGVLDSQLSRSLRRLVTRREPKDYAKVPDHELSQYV